MLRIAFDCFWKGFDPSCNWWIQYFNDNFSRQSVAVAVNQESDVLILSVFGNFAKTARNARSKIKILFSGENITHPASCRHLKPADRQLFDLIIGFQFTCPLQKTVRFPLWMFGGYAQERTKFDPKDNVLTHLLRSRASSLTSDTNRKFCATLVARHNAQGLRSKFSHATAEFMPVVWPGMNSPAIGPSKEDKMDFIRGSVFSICCENSRGEGYWTEKIFEALKGGCVPIYWADKPPEPDILDERCYIFVKDADVRSVEDIKAFLQPLLLDAKTIQRAPILKPGAMQALQKVYQELETALITTFASKGIVLSPKQK